MDFSEELWWQNLIEWIIDEGKIVTFKTLAGTLNVHVNMAKKMLATFYQGQQDKISAFYLIIGQPENNNGLSLQVVAEKDVKRTEASLKKITSKHIFALCRSKMDMSTADILQALEEINQDPNQMIPLRAIKNRKIKMTTKEERESTEPKTIEKVVVKPEPDIEIEDNKKEDNKKEDIKKEDNKKEDNKKANKSNEASKNFQDKDKGTKKGGGGSIAAMFAKAPPPKPKKPKEEPADSIPSPLVEEPSKDASQTKVNSKKREKPALKSNKKHKRIRMMSSSEEDEEDSTSESEKEEKKRYFTATEPESPEKEEQEDKENDEEVVPDTPKNEKQDTAQKRRRGRKLVNKTFLDDSGFMVTKKEYISCSESEEEEAKKSASQPKSKIPYTLGPSAKKPKSSEKSNEEQQSQPRKQATIKNFFTRK